MMPRINRKGLIIVIVLDLILVVGVLLALKKCVRCLTAKADVVEYPGFSVVAEQDAANMDLYPSRMPSRKLSPALGEDKEYHPKRKTSAKTKPAALPLYRPPVEQPIEQEVVSEPIEGLPDVIGDPDNEVEVLFKVGPPKLPAPDPDFQVSYRKIVGGSPKKAEGPSPVPEPCSLVLVGTGLIALASKMGRKK